MSGLARALVQDTLNQNQLARTGMGWLAAVAETVLADANSTITAAAITGGLVTQVPTAARTDTTDTAANISAAFPNMDVGDSYLFFICAKAAFALTIAGGTNVTASGNLTVPASTGKFFLLVKTAGGATPTFNLIGL